MLFAVNKLVTSKNAHSEYGLSIKETWTAKNIRHLIHYEHFVIFSLAVSLYFLPWQPVKQLDTSSGKNKSKNSEKNFNQSELLISFFL